MVIPCIGCLKKQYDIQHILVGNLDLGPKTMTRKEKMTDDFDHMLIPEHKVDCARTSEH